MKKMIALMLVLTLILTFAGSAMAVGENKPFHIQTDSTTEFMTGCYGITKTGNYWHIRVSTSTSNLSDTHRAVARVHQLANAASATWVYSGPNSTSHPYTADCQNLRYNISFRGRLDNRDSGTLQFHGDFYYNN